MGRAGLRRPSRPGLCRRPAARQLADQLSATACTRRAVAWSATASSVTTGPI
jgi:hypothetical protein